MFGGSLHEYSEEEEDLGKIYDNVLMRRLIAYLRPYVFEVTLIVLLTLISTAIRLVSPYLTKIAIDDYIVPKQLEGFRVIAFYLLFLLAVEFLFSYLETYRLQMMGQRIMRDFRMQIFTHLQRVDMNFFDQNPVGRLMTRVMGDVSALNELYTHGIITIVANLLSIGGIMFMMLWINWQLALVTFVVLPIILVMTTVYQIYSRRAFRDQRKFRAQINAFLQESIVGMTTMQLFTREHRSFEKFGEHNLKYLNSSIRSVFYFSVFFPMIEITGSLATAVIIWYGGGQIIQNTLSFGALVAFLQYAQRLFWPIRELSEKYTIFQRAMASSERVFDLLDTQPIIKDSAYPKQLQTVNSSIEFQNVSFAYREDDYVLNDVSFRIEPGEKVAIVGATGSGKTTLINLLCRFYDIEKGQILIDGLDIQQMKLDSLRKRIGIVQQDIFLFTGTIESNINLSNTSIQPDQVVAASKEVYLDPFVQNMPNGYGSEVKEGGSGLSVGQKQLVAFARALAFDPDILILDEATSSVDTETEYLIQDALSRLMSNRTFIAIAHRLSTIQNVDKILVMHRGRVHEMGSHNQLLQKRGLYYRLYQLQYKDQKI
ncbi:antibiotic ABC transporter ATP-binding protein [Candidatus Poribacteria bacterium]|nr:antibiotic ABC transporter ATP-binding protein [Candidatus Poribacteria bacterium]